MKAGMEKMRNDMIFKWMGIPYCILVILAAGACYNLFAYFQQIGAAMGYGPGTMKAIKYTVLFGYYLGLLPGYIVRAFRPTASFIIAAVLTLVSFTVLGVLTEVGTGGTLEWFLMLFFLFIGAMSGSIATIAAIVTSVKSFPKLASFLIIVIMISYYKIAPYLEFSIRSAFFEEPSLMWYFIALGAIMSVIFLLGAFAVKEVEFAPAIENMLVRFDKLGLLSYVLVATLLFGSFFVVALVYENWFIGAIIFISFIVLNFFVVGISFKLVYDKARSEKPSISGNKAQRKDLKFEEYISNPKYIALCFATMIVVGCGTTFSFNIFQIALAFGQVDQGDNLLDTFWAADMFARFVFGIVAYALINNINGYMWLVGGSVSAALGFGIALASGSAPLFLFIATVLIAIGVGLYWVMVPSIVMEDAGENNWGLNWGLTLFVSAFGMVVFSELFDWIYAKQGDGGDKCSGTSCNLIQFCVFGFLCLIAAGLTYYALQKDEEDNKKADKADAKKDGKTRDTDTKGKGDKKSRGDKDARSKSKDKKDGGARSKSKTKTGGERDKSKSKSKSKSKAK